MDNDQVGFISRRTALKRAGAGAAALWVAPAVLSTEAAFAGSPEPGPGNCSFPVTEGQTVTFSNLRISACDHITLGARIGSNDYELADKPDGCATLSYPDVVITAPVSGNVVPYMRDRAQGQCDCTYLSSNSTHAFCDGSTVYFQDSFFCNGECNTPHPAYPPGPGSFNGAITVTIS